MSTTQKQKLGEVANRSQSTTKKSHGNCSICLETKDLTNVSKGCQHEPSSCLDCLQGAARTEVTSKGQTQFFCQNDDCKREFQPEEYFPLLDDRLRGIVDKLLLNRVLEQDDEFRWCKSSKGCGSGQLVSNFRELKGYYTCNSCNAMMCYRHNMEWHQGFDCEEFDKEKANDPNFATESAFKEFTKECPNENCRTAIIKHEGCDVISCCRYGTHECNEKKGKCDHGGRPYCGQKFCWKCLGKIDVDHQTGSYHRHCKRTCDYFSLN